MEDIILGHKIYESIDFPAEFDVANMDDIFKPVDLIERYAKAVLHIDNIGQDFFDDIFMGAINNFMHSTDRDEKIAVILDAYIKFVSKKSTPTRETFITLNLIRPILRHIGNGPATIDSLFKEMLRYILASDLKIENINAMIDKVNMDHGDGLTPDQNITLSYLIAIINVSIKRNLQFSTPNLFYLHGIMTHNNRGDIADKIVNLIKQAPRESLTTVVLNLIKIHNKPAVREDKEQLLDIINLLISISDSITFNNEAINNILMFDLDALGNKEIYNTLYAIVFKAIQDTPDFELKELPRSRFMKSKMLPRISKNPSLLTSMTISEISSSLKSMYERLEKTGKLPRIDNTIVNVLKNFTQDSVGHDLFQHLIEKKIINDPEKVFGMIPEFYTQYLTGIKWLTTLHGLVNQWGRQNDTKGEMFRIKLTRAIIKYGDKGRMKPATVEKIKKYL